MRSGAELVREGYTKGGVGGKGIAELITTNLVGWAARIWISTSDA